MDVVIVAVVASVMGPGVLTLLQSRTRRAEKAQEWARQDEVAARLEAAQERSIEHTRRVAAELKAATTKLADDTEIANAGITERLDGLHSLVNGQLTAAMRAEVGAIRREVAVLKELIAVRENAGMRVSPENLDLLKAAEAKIVELEATIRDRMAQEVLLEAHQERKARSAENVIETPLPGHPDGPSEISR